LDEIKAFYKKFWGKDEMDSVKMLKTVKTTYGEDSVVEESIAEITIKEGRGYEDRYMWLIPGLRLINPGEEIKITIPWIVSVSFSQDTGLITSKRIYWDQASVLKQIGYLFSVAPKPNTFGIHANFSLPVLGADQAERLTNPSKIEPNKMAEKIISGVVSSGAKSPVSDQVTDIFSGVPVSERPKPSIMLQELSTVNKESHVFDDEELSPNPFSGKNINQKRYETNEIFSAPVRGKNKTSTRILRPGGTGGPSSVFNDTPLDPPKRGNIRSLHEAHIDFAGPVKEDPPARTRKISNRELDTTMDKVNDVVHVKLNKEMMETSDEVERPIKKHNPALVTSMDKEGSEAERPLKSPNPQLDSTYDKEGSQVERPKKKPLPDMEVTIGKEGSEVVVPIKKPNRALEPSDSEMPIAVKKKSNPALDSTLDKPLPPPIMKVNIEQQSHISSTGLSPTTSSFGDAVPPSPVKYISRNLNSTALPRGDNYSLFSPEEENRSRKSPMESARKNVSTIDFSKDEVTVKHSGRKFVENKNTNQSSLSLADDGGEIGLAPKSDVNVARVPPKQKKPRGAVGGKSSIVFG